MLQLGTLILQIDGLGLCASELSRGLADIGTGHDSGAVLVLADAQRTLVGLYRGLQQTLFGIKHTQLQVVLDQLRLQAEAYRRQIGSAGLHGRAAGLQPTAQPPPKVQLPAGCEIQVDRKSTRLNSSHVKISYAVF